MFFKMATVSHDCVGLRCALLGRSGLFFFIVFFDLHTLIFQHHHGHVVRWQVTWQLSKNVRLYEGYQHHTPYWATISVSLGCSLKMTTATHFFVSLFGWREKFRPSIHIDKVDQLHKSQKRLITAFEFVSFQKQNARPTRQARRNCSRKKCHV